jgi:phage repressor protein C with HTH and peptisase S24 domain
MEPRELIREARERHNWSQKDLAERAGVSQVAIVKIESGATVQSKFLPKIAQILGLDLADLDPTLKSLVLSAQERPQDRPSVNDIRPDFRVYASAEGSAGEIIRSSEPIDLIPRPSHLVHVKDAYGLLVTGSSMAPEYKNGEMAIVEPRLPVVADEVYIFYAEHDGEARATIKHLRRATAERWLVRQHNPPEGMAADFALSRKEWGVAHRVTGKMARR